MMFGINSKIVVLLLTVTVGIACGNELNPSHRRHPVRRHRANRRLTGTSAKEPKSSSCKYKSGGSNSSSTKYKTGTKMTMDDKDVGDDGDDGCDVDTSPGATGPDDNSGQPDVVPEDPDPVAPSPVPIDDGGDVTLEPTMADVMTLSPTADITTSAPTAGLDDPAPEPVIEGDCMIGTVYKRLYTAMDDETLFENALVGLFSNTCIGRCFIVPQKNDVSCPYIVLAADKTFDNGNPGWPRVVPNNGSTGCAWSDADVMGSCPYASVEDYGEFAEEAFCGGDAKAAAILQLRDAIANDACGFCGANLIGGVIVGGGGP